MQEYLDFNATTPVSIETADFMHQFLIEDFGNAGSRTHKTGSIAKQAVLKAREEIANIFDSDFSELVFTSGATESNNIAILGLADYAKRHGKTHIISSQIEHKAILDPLKVMESYGFEVTYIKPNTDGVIEENEVLHSIQDTTFLITIMHANNETGAINSINDIFTKAKEINPDIFCHSDAAQTFAKTPLDFTDKAVDMFSISAHKFHGPKGIGALLTRRREGMSLPLKPLMYGGGQEKGLRPGTLPVHLIAGMGHAAVSCHAQSKNWHTACLATKELALKAFQAIPHRVHGGTDNCLPNTLSISFADIHAEALIVCLKEVAEISTGSACTSASYSPSHVLTAMNLDEEEATKVVRFSWSLDTDPCVWKKIVECIKTIL